MLYYMMYSNKTVLLWLLGVIYWLSIYGFMSNKRFHVFFNRLKVNTRIPSHTAKDQFQSKKEVDGIDISQRFHHSVLPIFNNTTSNSLNCLNGSEVRVGIILSREYCYDIVQEKFKVNKIL